MRTLLKGWAGRISLFRKWKSVLIESKGNGDHYSKVGGSCRTLHRWETRCGGTASERQAAAAAAAAVGACNATWRLRASMLTTTAKLGMATMHALLLPQCKAQSESLCCPEQPC